MPTRICILLWGLPSSGKRRHAQKLLNSVYSGFVTKIANDDLDYDFDLYNKTNKEVVFIWNPAWLRDKENYQLFYNNATEFMYSISTIYFQNDGITSTCNAYSRYAQKGDVNYYKFIEKFIAEYSGDYEMILQEERAKKWKFEMAALEELAVEAYKVEIAAEELRDTDGFTLEEFEGEKLANGCGKEFGGIGEPKPVCLLMKC